MYTSMYIVVIQQTLMMSSILQQTERHPWDMRATCLCVRLWQYQQLAIDIHGRRGCHSNYAQSLVPNR